MNLPSPHLASLLVAASAFVILALGSIHLLYTFRGDRLHPRDPGLIAAMRAASPNLSRETTMWKTWIGFNASHSCGAMLFGLVYGYLALADPTALFGSRFLLTIGLVLKGLMLGGDWPGSRITPERVTRELTRMTLAYLGAPHEVP